jgi:hypothetical protein
MTEMDERVRNYTLPRIYFDSNAFIRGLIETDPHVHGSVNWKALSPEEQQKRICEGNDALKILSSWNPKLCFVSLNTLLETVDIGSRRYGLSSEYIINNIISRVNTDFTILFSTLNLLGEKHSLVKKFEEKLEHQEKIVYSQEKMRGQVSDEKGNPLGSILTSPVEL